MTDNHKIFFVAKTFKKHVYLQKSDQGSKEWTEKEDNQLIYLAKTVNIRKKWIFLEKYFPGKTALDLYSRYLKINPQIKKGKWTEEENARLKNLVSDFGFNWALIAKIMRNRNCKQIRSHYENYLKDNIDIYKSFSAEEDERLMKFNKLLGNQWTKYLNFFPDRSAKMIENRVSLLKKKSIEVGHKSSINVNEKWEIIPKISENSKFNNFYKLNLSISDNDYVSVFVFM